MPSQKLKKIRYAFIFSCLLALFSAQLPRLMGSIVGANSPATEISPSSAAVATFAPASSLCISGTLDNTDFVYNRAGTTPPCQVFTTGNLFDAYTFTVSGCSPATFTVSTCTGPCGPQTP